MDPFDLAAREHENMIAMFSGMASSAPGCVIRRDRGVAQFLTPLPIRLFNQVLIDDEGADPEALAAAVRLSRERRVPYVVNLRDGIDDRWVPRVRDLGLVELAPEPWMPGMAAHPLPAPGSLPPPAGHEIRRATDLDGIRDHIAAGSAGFGMPVEWFETVLGEATLADPGIAIYAGYTDGVPVTAGAGYRTGSTIGVYNIATVESARRKGYGAAMTMRIVDDGVAAGCDVAVLQSSDMGYPVYERLGFRTVVEYRGWVEPEPEE